MVAICPLLRILRTSASRVYHVVSDHESRWVVWRLEPPGGSCSKDSHRVSLWHLSLTRLQLLSTRVASVFPAGVSAALSVSSSDNGSWTDHLKELSSTPRAISASLMGSRYLDPSPARHGYFAEPRQHALKRNGREPTVRSEDDASSDDSHVDRRSRLSINEGGSTGHFPRPQFERQTMRSVLLCHLPEAVTHADITAVVRGGLVLDVFVRSKDKTASVSFLHQEDARAFYEYVRKNDLYINQKRVRRRHGAKKRF